MVFTIEQFRELSSVWERKSFLIDEEHKTQGQEPNEAKLGTQVEDLLVEVLICYCHQSPQGKLIF